MTSSSMDGTVIKILAYTESSNRSPQAAVGFTEDTGIESLAYAQKARLV